jgi:hypothetical protein
VGKTSAKLVRRHKLAQPTDNDNEEQCFIFVTIVLSTIVYKPVTFSKRLKGIATLPTLATKRSRKKLFRATS